eukprot:gene2646-3052_t
MTSAAQIFTTLESIVQKEGADVVKSINGIYQFNITTAAGVKVWSADLKTGSGSIKAEKHVKPDCTISMAENDFVDLMNGKINGQNAFMQKKLKIGGNMALAMKLNNLVKKLKSAPAAAAPAAAAAAPASTPGAVAASLDDGTPLGKQFSELAKTIAGKPELVKSVNGVYLFNIASAAATRAYTVDLKNGAGCVKSGPPTKADCTITMKEEDFLALMTGKSNGQVLFGQGKLKIAGNMGLAMKLGQLAKKPAAKL